jgi:predicted nuclease of restriction endonuclease-like (RecB) superfamily
MENAMPPLPDTYNQLLDQIAETLESGRQMVWKAANSGLLMTYWGIGQRIVEYEQQGSDRAVYGTKLLGRLSKDLTLRHGKGFSRSNVNYMRLFYKRFPIVQTVSVQLEWGHYCEIFSIDDEFERSFYLKQCEIEAWSVKELRRQVKSMLFHRLALSKDKEGVLELARNGHRVQKPEDLLRDPFMLEFLGIPEKVRYKEKHLEKRLITYLQDFLLEMGRGFAFIGRQYRIQIDGNFYRIDLLFYHRILKCFVIIDLKTGSPEHKDVGQMNMYLNYFNEEENQPDDNPPIGIILAAGKAGLAVQYALGGLSTQIFVSRYQLYLPDRQLLEDTLRGMLDQ